MTDAKLTKIKDSEKKSGDSQFMNEETDEYAQEIQRKKYAENERLKGNECMKSKDYDQSVDCYTKSIEIFPDEPATFSNRAMAYLKMKQFKNAISDADKCLELKPDYIKAYHRRGKAYLGMKQYDKAISDFQYILERDPHNKEINRDLLNARVDHNE